MMKAAGRYHPLVLFIMLYKVVITFMCVDEILKCDHSNKSCESSAFLWRLFMLYNVVSYF